MGNVLDGLSYLLQQLVNGITLGSIYGLIALGYTMVFGIIGMVNFAHGDVFMVSAFIALILYLLFTQLVGIPSVIVSLLLVLVLTMALTAFWSIVIERVAYRPLRGSFRLAPLISAIGVSIFLMNFVQVVQGPNNKSLPPLLDGGFRLPLDATHWITISWKQIGIVGLTAVLLAMFWFLVQKTALGRAQRACEQDRKMAALLGIDVDRTIATTFAIGGALAAVAGTMYLVLYGVVNHHDGFVPGIKAFAAAVLGGIGSLPGAVLGGLIIGLVETLWAAYVSSDYKDVVAFAVLALTLVVKPTGLLGKPEVEKV
jgi:branched-chain amino acid transport system permease protein